MPFGVNDYRGRLAPSPTGYLHLGHARTFWRAQQRARERQGVLILRNEDLDPARSRPEFAHALYEDLKWFGFEWQEGPDCGGEFGPYEQSRRRTFYREAFERLRSGGCLYPCVCSRKDVLAALSAPHVGEEEPVYPGTCRPALNGLTVEALDRFLTVQSFNALTPSGPRLNWRFLVPDGEAIEFEDALLGPQRYVAGVDFGDFVVWRHDDVPSYQLAVVVDDHAMRITEVVRGADLLLSTARQLLLYRALGWRPPGFYHCPLLNDEHGVRLAKRHDALSLRTLRGCGATPEQLRQKWDVHPGIQDDWNWK